jgi:hypothetical protein
LKPHGWTFGAGGITLAINRRLRIITGMWQRPIGAPKSDVLM